MSYIYLNYTFQEFIEGLGEPAITIVRILSAIFSFS